MKIPAPNSKCSMCGRDEDRGGAILCTKPIDKLTHRPGRLWHWCCESCRTIAPGILPERGVAYRWDEFATKLITLREPWAWLICTGYKACENRSQRFGHEGRVLIHAAGVMDLNTDYAPAVDLARKFGVLLPEADFFKDRLGTVVGCAYFERMARGLASGWYMGAWAWPIRWAWPVTSRKIKGQLSMWTARTDFGITPLPSAS